MNSFLSSVAPGLTRFESNPKIIIGFSRLEDGGMSMNRGEKTECLIRRERFFSRFHWRLKQTVWGELEHSNKVEFVSEADVGKGAFAMNDAIPQTDGLWTTTPNLLLCTTHADCLPLYYVIPQTSAVGIAHCGWRGIVNGLPQKMIQCAIEKLHVEVGDFIVGIGPGIRVECFEVGEDLLDKFPEKAIARHDGKWFVDLPAVVKYNLTQAGVKLIQIDDSGLCSKCTPLFSSFRRDQSSVEPAVAFIGIRS